MTWYMLDATSANILTVVPNGTNVIKILIYIWKFSFQENALKMSLHVLNQCIDKSHFSYPEIYVVFYNSIARTCSLLKYVRTINLNYRYRTIRWHIAMKSFNIWRPEQKGHILQMTCSIIHISSLKIFVLIEISLKSVSKDLINN